VLGWLLFGALVYIAALRSQARALDAELEASDPDVVALRGRRPLVLTPVANPANAEALVSVAHALAPPEVGRVTRCIVSRGDRAAVSVFRPETCGFLRKRRDEGGGGFRGRRRKPP
jgi:hypothetical protein